MLNSSPLTIRFIIIATSLVLSSLSINAQATLTRYTANDMGVVYSSVSDVTWTKDGNLLGSMFTTQGFDTVVDAIIAASPTITNTPSNINLSGIYTISSTDFMADGRTSWFGAMAFINYLNNIEYAGSDQWRLPTIVNFTIGYNTPSNGSTTGSEYSELFYQELGSGAALPINLTPTFINEQVGYYWSGTEYANDSNISWFYNMHGGRQTATYKYFYLYAWAVSPGKFAWGEPIAVPEPERVALLIPGLGLIGIVLRRRRG
jgi:hypothetical protein